RSTRSRRVTSARGYPFDAIDEISSIGRSERGEIPEVPRRFWTGHLGRSRFPLLARRRQTDRRAFAAVAGASIALLGHTHASADRETEHVDRRLGDEQATRAADLGATQLQIDGGAKADGAHHVDGRETVGFDQLLVTEDAARCELELPAPVLGEAKL